MQFKIIMDSIGNRIIPQMIKMRMMMNNKSQSKRGKERMKCLCI